MTTARPVVAVLAAVFAAAFASPVATPQQMSDAQVRQALVRESIASYSGSCPCPYSTDRAGRRCGGRSAYSRPGGAAPLCNPSDVTAAQVAAYRRR